MTVPDFETLILERLYASHSELKDAGQVNGVFEQWPLAPIEQGDMPAICVMLGAEQTNPQNNRTPGSYTVTRLYTVTVLIMPLSQGVDIPNVGAEALDRAKAISAIMRNHYLSHPRLKTTDLPALRYLFEDITFRDSGVIEKRAPGGSTYLAIDFTLTLSMRADTPVGRS